MQTPMSTKFVTPMPASVSPGVILIVEDHPLVQITASAMIEDAGLRTVIAGDADEAIEILSTRDDICCVFTDIEMPGSMDGLALAVLVKRRWPHIQLVVTSGGQPPHALTLPIEVSFFQKPYDYASVIEELKAIAA